MSEDPFLVAGKIVAPHGIRGEVKLQIWIDDSDFLTTLDAIYLQSEPEDQPPQLITLERARLDNRGAALLKFAGVDSREAAEELRGREVLVRRSWAPPLEEDEYYVQDLIGLKVVTVDGEHLGRLTEVIFTGEHSNEVYRVRGGRRGEVLLPAIADVVQQVDLKNQQIIVRLPEGLL